MWISHSSYSVKGMSRQSLECRSSLWLKSSLGYHTQYFYSMDLFQWEQGHGALRVTQKPGCIQLFLPIYYNHLFVLKFWPAKTNLVFALIVTGATKILKWSNNCEMLEKTLTKFVFVQHATGFLPFFLMVLPEQKFKSFHLSFVKMMEYDKWFCESAK